MRPIRRLLVIAFVVGTFVPSALWAEEADMTRWFPTGYVFQPLIADPRELHFRTEMGIPVAGKVKGQVALGDYFGFFRFVGDSGLRIQSSVGGGVFARFALASKTNDMEVADFYANLPVDVSWGPWSGRFMLYHTSSHLGDDYIKQTGSAIEKHSWDHLKWLVSCQPLSRIRLYSGYTYVIRTLPQNLGRSAFQGGVELTSPIFHTNYQWYWANDFQSWQRVEWNPMFHSELGLRIRPEPGRDRGLGFFVQFVSGRMPQGQFFLRSETQWTGGVRFYFQ